jgi:hypothetical protein
MRAAVFLLRPDGGALEGSLDLIIQIEMFLALSFATGSQVSPLALARGPRMNIRPGNVINGAARSRRFGSVSPWTNRYYGWAFSRPHPRPGMRPPQRLVWGDANGMYVR